MQVQVVYYTYQNDPQGYQLNQIIDLEVMDWEAFKHGDDSQKMYQYQQMYSYRVQRMVFQVGYSIAQQVNANVSFPVPPLTVQKPPVPAFTGWQNTPTLPYVPNVHDSPPVLIGSDAVDQAEENEQEPEKAIEPYRHPSDWE